MNALNDLISLILFVISLIILYQTTNHWLSLLTVIAIATLYIIKHYKLSIFVKKELTTQVKTLERLFNLSSDVLLYFDMDLKLVACNDALTKYLHINKKEYLGKSLQYLIQKNAKSEERYLNIWKSLNKKIEESIATKSAVGFYFDYQFNKDNSYTSFNILIFPTFTSDNHIKGVIIVARDVTSEYRAVQIAKEKEKQLQCILENMPLCAYMKDKNDNFVVGSNSFEKMVNCENNNDVKQLILSDIYDEDYLKLIKREESNIYKTKKVVIAERQIVLPNQSFWARVRKVPVLDSKGDVKYLVVIYENIEQEREIERQKEYFIETLIHDLKVPTLAQLRGLELLQKQNFGKINKEQKDLLVEIQSSCESVLDMISMVLNTYRFEKGQNKLLYQSFYLSDLLLESFKEVSYLAQEKRLSFVYKASDKNTFVEADKQEIKKVILNLLSNAVIYSNKDAKILVDIKSTADNQLIFTISNEGIILSERECSDFFMKGAVAAPKYTNIGHGISLYLSKKIIDAHNGKIFASTDGEKTNTFTFIIPQYASKHIPKVASPLFI